MTTSTIPPYNNTKALISFLADDDYDSQVYALNNLSKNLSYLWHELIDQIELLINLQADPNFPEKSLINSILAKIFYHKEDYENSLNYILLAKDHFDITQRNRFVNKLLSHAVERYSAIQKHNYTGEDKIEMDENLKGLMNFMFSESIKNERDQNVVAGIAVECRRMDILKQLIANAKDLSQLLNHLFSISQNHVQSKAFRDALIRLIFQAYATTGKEGKDAWNVCHCYLHLGMAKETAQVIMDLVSKGNNDSILLALQISSDIQEAENMFFTEELLKEVDLLTVVDQDASAAKEKVINVLNGKFIQNTSYKFLSMHNKSNKSIITKLKKFCEKKNSVIHNAIINCYAILHAGTLDDTFLNSETNKEWVHKSDLWEKFTSVACLGTIHKSNPQIEEKLTPYYPGGEGASKGQWVNGGALYALGLANSGTNDKEKIEFLSSFLESDKEAIIHGACLGLGLIGMSSFDLELVEKLKVYLYSEDATMGEASAYGIGLIMAGKMNIELLEELLNTCKENSHEKIIRGLSVSLAMMCYQYEEQALPFIEKMLSEKDPLIRYGGVFALGMAYVGIGNNKTLKKLLTIAASDISDDVRRAAAISIGFVMLNDYKKVPKIINLLANSYNAHVRYGAAMALGISCANTNYSEAVQILKNLQDDNSDFVRQGVSMSMALVLQQAIKNHNKNVEEFRNRLMAKAKKKSIKRSEKFGAIIALGLLEAGGKNSLVKLKSESGTNKRGAIMGMLLYTQFWYWFPMLQMVGLSLEPTFLMGVNKDLKIPKGFKFKCNTKKSTFWYPPIVQAKMKEESKVKVVLSITKRAEAKKALKKDGGMEEETPKKKPKTGEKGAMEEEKKEETKDETEKGKEEEEEEEPTTILHNPSRILRIQEKFIEYLPTNRYQAILQNRKRGLVFLKDTTPDVEEEYVDDEPLEAWLIPPPEFYFDESLQDN